MLCRLSPHTASDLMACSWNLRQLCLVILLASWSLDALRSGGSADEEHSLPTIRVMTSNVRYGTAKDGENSWTYRRDLLADVWRQTAADVIGTQEMLPMQAAYLEQRLPGYAYVGRSRELDNEDGEQCGEGEVL